MSTSNIIQSKQVILGNIYAYTFMHAKRVNENEAINLKESKKVYVGLEGGKEHKMY